LEDILKKTKSDNSIPDNNYLRNLMGPNLLIALYPKLGVSDSIDVQELLKLELLPSEFIMDNQFFYGEHKIFDHLKIEPTELNYPFDMRYSDNSLSLMWGEFTYKETNPNLSSDIIKAIENLYKSRDENGLPSERFSFRKTSTNFSPSLKLSTLKRIISTGDSSIYYECERISNNLDLRDSRYDKIRRAVMENFGLNPDMSYSENLSMIKNQRIQ
jgi:hypothetical protein